MIENLLVLLGGISIGTLMGIMPGINHSIAIIIAFPFLLEMDLFQCLLFWLSVGVAGQFTGSVVATTLGIPGEESSLPAVKEGNALFKQGRGSLAISGAAIGSVVGSFIAVCMVLLAMPIAIDLIKDFYSNSVQLTIFLFVVLFMLFYNDRPIWENGAMLAFGIFLGAIGLIPVPLMLFAPEIVPYKTFPMLTQGLPVFPVIVALFVVPIMLNNHNINLDNVKDIADKLGTFKLIDHFKEYLSHIGASLRGSVIGAVSGLVPHMTTVLASNLSYFVEKKIGQAKGTYKTNGDMKSLVAAETANNSAGFLSLMPLLLIGIPVSGSEAILLNILDANLFAVNYTTTIESGIFADLVVYFILANILAFLIAWPMVKHLHYVYTIPMNTIHAITVAVLFILTFYIGSMYGSILYYFAVLIFLIPIGYLLRRADTLIVILGFVLSDKIIAASYRSFILWTY